MNKEREKKALWEVYDLLKLVRMAPRDCLGHERYKAETDGPTQDEAERMAEIE